MNPLAATWEVCRWEFSRYFKLKQQIISALITGLAVAVGMGLGRRDSGRDPVDIAVVGPGAAAVAAQSSERLRLSAHDAAQEPALREAVGRGDLAGLLVLRDERVQAADLVLRSRGAWVAELEVALNEHARRVRLQQEGVSPEVLMRVLEPAGLQLAYHESARPPLARGERVIFLIAVSFVLMSLITGVSYLFGSITGEKQIRVTEQVISAISAQSWIDGKIIGLAALSLVTVLNTALVIVAVLLVAGMPAGIGMPAIAGNPVAIALILLFSLLGFLFWFAFMAAIAALIEDPHTSTRSSLLFLPMLAGGLSFLALADPDSTLVRNLSIAPPTSATMLPARLLLTDVPATEIAASFALLVAAVLLLRLAAGRVFRIAMLMYGKEPTWSEVRRWAWRGADE